MFLHMLHSQSEHAIGLKSLTGLERFIVNTNLLIIVYSNGVWIIATVRIWVTGLIPPYM